MIPQYVQGFPQDNSSLGNTRVQIRNNLDGTFLTLAVDHIDNNGNPSSGTPGYHRVIHYQDQGSSTPPTVSGVTQEYTNTDTHSIQQIKLKSTGGNVYQQTTMLDAFAATFGPAGGNNNWTYLPGGMILIRGATGAFTGVQTVNFAGMGGLGFPAMSNSNYNVQITPYANSISIPATLAYYIRFDLQTASSFSIENDSTSRGFYYTLIGFPA